MSSRILAPGFAATFFSVVSPFGQSVSIGASERYGKTTVRRTPPPNRFRFTNSALPSGVQLNGSAARMLRGPSVHFALQIGNDFPPFSERNSALVPPPAPLSGLITAAQRPSGDTVIR